MAGICISNNSLTLIGETTKEHEKVAAADIDGFGFIGCGVPCKAAIAGDRQYAVYWMRLVGLWFYCVLF